MVSYKPVGWRRDNYRHYLAAKYGSAGHRYMRVKRTYDEDLDEEFARVDTNIGKTETDVSDLKEAMRQVQQDMSDPETPLAEKARLSESMQKMQERLFNYERDELFWKKMAKERGYMSRKYLAEDNNIEFTPEKLKRFDKEMEAAKARGDEQFEFEGKPVLVAYGKYLSEYLHMRMGK